MAKKAKHDVYEQESIHQGGHSGLPVQPDGNFRESSNMVPPIVKNNTKPVNPKD